MLVLKYLKIKLQKYKQSKAKPKLKLKTVLHQQGELNVERISNGQDGKNKIWTMTLRFESRLNK